MNERERHVRLESPTLGVEATFDPRGEVELAVFRLGHEEPGARWTYTGMVGRASVERLLEIAAGQLRDEPALLRGDPDFFERLRAKNRREAAAWTAYYSGTGSRPQTGELP